jgi:hypothetical protein
MRFVFIIQTLLDCDYTWITLFHLYDLFIKEFHVFKCISYTKTQDSTIFISTNNSLLHICGAILFDAKNYNVVNTRKYYV